MQEILQQMFQKFQISNRLPNRCFPKSDFGCPCFYKDSKWQIQSRQRGLIIDLVYAGPGTNFGTDDFLQNRANSVKTVLFTRVRKIFAGVSFGMAFLTKGRNLHNVQSRCKSGTAPVKSFDLLLIRSNTCAPFCSNIWACRIPWVLVKTKGGSVQGFVRYVQKICPHVLCQAIN